MGQSELAFRAQLVVREQRQIYDYWCACAGNLNMPSRGDINPSDIPHLLPFVSLIDIEEDPVRYKVRLAGTSLYDIYGGEITGKYVDDLDWAPNQDYWISSFRRVVEAALPAQGVVRSPYERNEHLTQFWLRLPLANAEGKICMILCYDAFVPITEAITLVDELPSSSNIARA